MALTISEANAVNVLVRWLAQKQGPSGQEPCPDQAERAMGLLVDHANKTLMAGLSPADVPVLFRWIKQRIEQPLSNPDPDALEEAPHG
jgi:hypothetical protein